MLAAALVVPALPLVVSAPAHAATNIICVNRDASETDCTSRPATLQLAIDQAKQDLVNASVIRIGPGVYVGPFTFDGSLASLTVQGNNNGTGTNATLIQGGVTVTNATMRNVRVAAVNGGTALTVSSDASSSVGNVIVADTAAAPATNAVGIVATAGRVQNTTVNLDRAAGNTGIRTSGTTTLSRVTTRTSQYGVVNTNGPLQIDNALIELGSSAVAGLRVGTDASTSATVASAKHLTVVGGAAGARGVWAFSDDAAAPATITLDNSIVWGPATSVSATAGPGTADLGIRYSDYQTEQELGGDVTSVEGNLDVDPAFRNPATGDYELRAGSPVVDKASLGLTTATDRDDRGRAFDGDGNGSQVPDMGAFELNDITAPTSTFTSGPSGPTNNRQPVFQFRSNENGARLECALDGGAFQPCTSPATTPPLADGSHSFSVRSTDAAFNVENPPVTRTFTVDTVAPNATITKKPAKRFYKKRVKFKFAVDEPGATLQCNLDGKGWRKCNAVWKFNTKVGKHVMLVRAVDAAGNVDATPARYKYKRLPQKKRR